MLEKIKALLKKRFSDVILVIAVIAVFFLTGRKNTDELELTGSEDIAVNGTQSINLEPTSNNSDPLSENPQENDVNGTTNIPTNNQVPSINNFPNSNTASNPPQFVNPVVGAVTGQNKKNFQPPSNPPPPNGNQNIFPTNSNSKLGESLKGLKGQTASTEDIVNRNAYFQKLSNQLNELQGDASSESTGDLPNENSDNINPDSNNLNTAPQNNFPIQTEENYNGANGSLSNQPYPQDQFEENNMENPYGELNRFPPPEIAQ